MTPATLLDWRNVSSTHSGRRILAQLIKEFGEGADVFCAGSSDKTAYQAGRASSVTTIRSHLNEISPTLFFEIMLDKAKEEELTRKSRTIER